MGSFSHILAGFSLGFQYRRELKLLLDITSSDSVLLKLDPEAFRSTGIRLIALDFDGVLSHHGASAPLSETIGWIKRCEEVFGSGAVFILSNKPTDERIAWFEENFPAISFVSATRKKPFPDGLEKVAEMANVPTSSVLMIDDRLLTGCLAALVAGAAPCYIRHPYISFGHQPLAELFFLMLRIIERFFVRLTSIC